MDLAKICISKMVYCSTSASLLWFGNCNSLKDILIVLKRSRWFCYLGPEEGRVEDSRPFFLSFCCRNVVVFDNLRRATSPTLLSTVVSGGLVRMRFENKL